MLKLSLSLRRGERSTSAIRREQIERRRAIVQYEAERALESELGVGRHPESMWAAQKRGGPVHFWYRLTRDEERFTNNPPRALWGLTCELPMFRHQVYERHSIGKPREVRTSRSLCRECVRLVIEQGR